MNAHARMVMAFCLVLAWAPASPPRAGETPCMDCHELSHEAEPAGVHAILECTDCHAGAAEFPHGDDPSRVDCALCHAEAVEAFGASIHGPSFEDLNGGAVSCSLCHGQVHRLLPSTDPASPVHPARLPGTCGACHANPEMAHRYRLRLVQPIQAYQASVHGRALQAGRMSADCTSCHGSHDIRPAADPASQVNHARVQDTCGACHQEIAAVYAESIHGQAHALGIRESPVCTDCHGEHRILSPAEKGSPVYATNIPKQTCGRCHGDLRLARKFGLPESKVPAYQDSYHGLASRSGVQTVANCGSCHGVHDVLPSSDPRSTVHPANLPATCGKCHPGALARTSIGPVHVQPTEKGANPAAYYVRLAYLWLIVLTVSGMLLHNGMDLLRKMLTPPARPKMDDAQLPERMSMGFRIAHILMAGSFVALVYTGFALTYPEAWWARPLLSWEESLGLRGYLHRTAALVMLAALAFHAVHLLVDRRARTCIRQMVPGRHDAVELKERIRYFLGRRPQPPASPALGYAEKMEYLALIWGSLVMAVSGFLLWFEDFTLRYLPAGTADLATVVHLYEAILASLAILVWHFYFVIFDPVVYPMDRAWLTGRSPAARALERAPAAGTDPAEAT